MSYNVRVTIYETQNGRNACITFSDETLKLFDKPYVTVKRMNDRLALVPWERKTERGMCLIANSKVQFGQAEVIDKIVDFCGEYDLVTKADNGMVYVKLSDKKVYTRVGKPQKGIAHKRVGEVIDVTNATLVELLKVALAEKQAEWDKLEKDRVAAQEMLDEIVAKQERCENELNTYQKAMCVAEGR